MSSKPSRLRLGTRGSRLALVQATTVRQHISAAHGWAEDEVELIAIRTSGDLIQDRALAEAGGKGLFTKELDVAVLDRRLDIAVHSAKDLPTLMPEGIVIAGYLPREDVRDAFIARAVKSLRDLPAGAIVGSASLRREAQLRRLRPDLAVKLLRGNVETRLKRIEMGEFDATLLALAGLKRLGLSQHATAILDIQEFLPAVGQGAIAITARTDDESVYRILEPLFDAATTAAVIAERSFLAVLEGSCRTPIAGHAISCDGRLQFRGMVLRPDGSQAREVTAEGAASEAAHIGQHAGLDLRAQLPDGFMNR
jgi:hydroxymethylbilane synthase